MRIILIILMMVFTLSVASSDTEFPQQQKASNPNFDKKKSPAEQEIYRLRVLVANLEAENREAKRKYYAAKTKIKELESTVTTSDTTEETYTRAEVQGYLDQRSAEVSFESMVYNVAEEQFLLSLTTIEDVNWLLNIMITLNMEKLANYRGSDESYKQEIEKIVADYQSYYNSQRLLPVAEPIDEEPTEIQ